MSLVRDICGEIAKALAVLALVFLSFAHQPVAIAQPADGDVFSLADIHSYCGSPAEEEPGHAPCHACRAGVADLPAAPCVAEPAYLAFADAGFVLSDETAPAQTEFSPANPRAPPALV